jgi:ArsR family transcriptional regulator
LPGAYNTFKNSNVLKTQLMSSLQKISDLFRVLGQPSRLEILLAIGTGEACVCHLEAATGWRQAYISQHLMALRSEGLVTSRRDGRNIYYRIKNAGVLDLIRKAAGVTDISDVEAAQGRLTEPLPNCTCPNCSAREIHTCVREAPNQAVGNS